MTQETLESLTKQLEKTQQLLKQGNNEALQSSIQFAASYTKALSTEQESLDLQISHNLLSAIAAVNEKAMDKTEWVKFGIYLHNIANIILQATIETTESNEK